MSEQLVSKENLSLALAADIFESAYLSVTDKNEGGFTVSEGGRSARITIDEKGKRFVCFRALYRPKAGTTHAQRVDYINKVNESLITVRAEIAEHSDLNAFVFDYYLWVEGGVTHRNVVMAFKAFLATLEGALELDAEDVIA